MKDWDIVKIGENYGIYIWIAIFCGIMILLNNI